MTPEELQYSYHTAPSDAVVDDAFFIGFVSLIILASFVATIIKYVVTSLCLMSIFKKTGTPTWIAWVPFYNIWKLLELGGQAGFWSVLFVLPVINLVSFVYLYIAQYHIGLRFGKSGSFVLWAIFIPFVWFIWLAVDSSQWHKKQPAA